MRLLSNVLRVDQSILTGESGSVEKEVDATRLEKAVYQDKTCILFSVAPRPPLSSLPSCAEVLSVAPDAPGSCRGRS